MSGFSHACQVLLLDLGVRYMGVFARCKSVKLYTSCLMHPSGCVSNFKIKKIKILWESLAVLQGDGIMREDQRT